ncbi:glycoside hydrolase family 2 TIM barrel-domain containing protein [Flavivirga abyssicola]|uniref:glycoside hydrolase family 2 protein n=1 Tax=Flavivirga abyssicola TaxID=3063533 RepID=UPI0026DEA494|nr:glycoside hydrolase family 2 TIM barrel-domain containing protein [Flavivirga sp. MEBiC07777]WVK13462.1 glycoside hydrolase family 2 TIM barrel-domain containing protein [Flavivirga sp. MEBiC07777]
MNIFFKRVVTVAIFLSYICLTAQIPALQDRSFVKLDHWKFSKGIDNQGHLLTKSDLSWQDVIVPHSYSMDAIKGIGYYKGQAWYRTILKVPESMKEERIFIRFEGVGQEAIVYLNGEKIGKHVGGYSAFCFEVTDKIKFEGKNVLAVNVTNAPSFKRIPVDDALFNHYGGIYRPVQMFSTPKCNITPTYFASSGVFIEATEVKSNKAKLEIRTHISNQSSLNEVKIKYIIRNKASEIVSEAERLFETIGKDLIATNHMELDRPILWNGKLNPYQYSLEVQLFCGNTIDKITQKFGVKTYQIDSSKGFILNDEPYNLHGVCKHQEREDVGPAMNKGQLVEDMELIDEIGATVLRLSHYQHSDKTYELADEKGILVWAEIPFVHDWSGREGSNAKQQLQELILQNYNHPSIFVWGLWNEVRAWSGEKTPSVVLTKELKKLSHELDKTRLTISASDRDIVSTMGGITDLQAWNKYFGWYTPAIEGLSNWLDSSHKKFPNTTISISEYGAGGNIQHQDINKLEKPKGMYFPEQFQTEYHEKSWEIIKNRPFVWSSFVWNMFDFSVAGWNRGGVRNLNHKGLITFDRKVKKDAFYFYKANWSDKPVLYIAERRHKDRTQEKTSVKVYTNLSKVTLYVNDKKIKTQKLTSDINSIVFNDIQLKEGNNSIKVISKGNSLKLEDSVIWTLKKSGLALN